MSTTPDTTNVPIHQLSGPALDWAIATALKLDPSALGYLEPHVCIPNEYGMGASTRYSPHSNWALGSKLIAEHHIMLRPIQKPGHPMHDTWLAGYEPSNTGSMVQWIEYLYKNKTKRRYWPGATMLEAGLRCVVARHLDTNTVPNASVAVPKRLLARVS